MFIDASALCAILADEPEARDFASRIDETAGCLTSPTAVWETVAALSRIRNKQPIDAEAAVRKVLGKLDIEVVAIPPEATALAIQAYDRFGKGRHPAALNFGDCFAYACARHYRVPLLYKGDDFAQTDIEAA